ncbi:hypothetical protein RHGRI_020186 [Rhododendron griersonianum]|uniref:CCHC-type domain-containing protein n=1 Tax=Rhododendron griersonianum TaxID=479676 RepID=A0AAV6JKQ6_9ERIC|nr:hypothetical protein RHGRI_020186 [Rhododendron griersonianum]
MAGRRRKQNVEEPQARERDLRDVEVDDLRRQVQQFQLRLQHYETLKRVDSRHGSEDEASDEEEVNPFHRTSSHASSGGAPRYQFRRNRYFQQEYGVKVEIPEFEGRMHPDEFLDWLNTVERIFEYKDIPEDRKVKLVAIKLKKHASLWWEHLKKQRDRDGKRRVKTWEKMKKELRRKFLPDNYRQDAFLKFHNFEQKELTVEEYTAEFDQLQMRCDILEPEEQTIARYLRGLRSEIRHVVQLQPYWTYNDVVKLSFKVEKQLKESRGSTSRTWNKESNSNRANASSTNKEAIFKPNPKKETAAGSSNPRSYNPSSRRCYKCQGFGHIAADCPNRKMVSLVEEEMEEEKETTVFSEPEDDDEITYADHGESLVIQRSLNAAHVEEDSWLRNNIFHTKCTAHGKIGNESYEEARVEEAGLFQTHPLLSKIDESMVGVPVLAQKLVQIQATIISRCLPDIVWKINEKLNASISELNKMPQNLSSVAEAMTVESLKKILLRGEFDEYPDEKHMHCTARLVEMLNQYSDELQKSAEDKSTNNFLLEEIRKKVKEISKTPVDFIPKVWYYILQVVISVFTNHYDSYPQLQASTIRASRNLMEKMKQKSFDHVMEIVEMEKLADYTCSPEYTSEWGKLMAQQNVL